MRPPDAARVAIGNLDSPHEALVSAGGAVEDAAGAWAIGWRLRTDDEWLDPEPWSQRRIDGAPVVETAVRVPKGQVLHRAWCARDGRDELVVVEVENRSPSPVAVAYIASGRIAPELPRPPARIDDGAFVYPVPHTATVRIAASLDGQQRAGLDIAHLPPPDRVANGWRLHVERGMRADLPDGDLAEATRAAVATLLVAHDGPRLDRRGRRVARAVLARWGQGDARQAPAVLELLPADVAEAVDVLTTLRDRLVRETSHDIELATPWPDDWLGQGLDVHEAPTRAGRLSYAVRWHGARPALLWELTPTRRRASAVTLRVPALDPAWSTTEPAGEALLSPVEPPGGLPKVVAPLAGERTPADDAPDGGESFG